MSSSDSASGVSSSCSLISGAAASGPDYSFSSSDGGEKSYSISTGAVTRVLLLGVSTPRGLKNGLLSSKLDNIDRGLVRFLSLSRRNLSVKLSGRSGSGSTVSAVSSTEAGSGIESGCSSISIVTSASGSVVEEV